VTLQPFTWKYYDACLAAARASGYRFVGFADVQETRLPSEPFILLRHDVDYDPEYADLLATHEARQGIQATYFFQADSRFYDLESPRVEVAVRRILAEGHWLGLHYDATRVEEDTTIIQRVDAVAETLEERFGQPVHAVSFHMPTYRPVGHLQLQKRRLNVYASTFFGPIEYVSDSNQDFRGKDLLAMLRAGSVRRLQLLIHPFWWRDAYSSMAAKMEALASKLNLPVSELLTAEQRVAIGQS
jgi:hypothetical protein